MGVLQSHNNCHTKFSLLSLMYKEKVCNILIHKILNSAIGSSFIVGRYCKKVLERRCTPCCLNFSNLIGSMLLSAFDFIKSVNNGSNIYYENFNPTLFL